MAKKNGKKTMPFEEPLIQLRTKISELKEYTANAEVDLSSEIKSLEDRFSKLEEEIYENMKPWDRVQVARHPERPTTLDYIPMTLSNCMAIAFTGTMKRSSVESLLFTASRLRLSAISAAKIRKRMSDGISACRILKATGKLCA